MALAQLIKRGQRWAWSHVTFYLSAHAADYQVNGFGNDSSRDCKPKGEVNNTCLLNRDADISG